MKRFSILVLVTALAGCDESSPATTNAHSLQSAAPPARPSSAPAAKSPTTGAVVERIRAGQPFVGADLVPEVAPSMKDAADQLSADRLTRFIAFHRALVGHGALIVPLEPHSPDAEAARERSGLSWEELRALTLLTGDYYPTLRIVRDLGDKLAELRARAQTSKEAAEELAILEGVSSRHAAKLERHKEIFGEKALAILDAAADQYFALQDEVFAPKK